jgi:hypothetical protein
MSSLWEPGITFKNDEKIHTTNSCERIWQTGRQHAVEASKAVSMTGSFPMHFKFLQNTVKLFSQFIMDIGSFR